MKRHILIFIIFLIANCTEAQLYHKLIKTNSVWDEYSTILPAMCYTSGARHYFTNQDTVINGLTYRVCMSQQIIQVNPGPFCPPFEVSSNEYIAVFMREDTIAKTVYINSSQTGGMDELLYDFSLSAGDTLKSTYLGAGETIIILAVEDLILNNGKTRKNFIINPTLNSSYIEGIGSSYGLFAQIPITFCECAGGYFCVKEDEVSLLGSGYLCNLPYVGEEEIKLQEFRVYPNPVINNLNINIKKSHTGSRFEINNLLGVKCLDRMLNNETNVLEISDFDPGIYLYQITTNNTMEQGRFIKY
jgi:hypothetical protein